MKRQPVGGERRFGTVPGIETSVVAFATDIPALTAWGTPYLFGPGSIHVAHSDHEFIEIVELRRAVDRYEQIVRAILRRERSPISCGISWSSTARVVEMPRAGPASQLAPMSRPSM